jgi:hypothetical protein
MAYLPGNYENPTPYNVQSMRTASSAVEDNIGCHQSIGLGIIDCGLDLPSTRLPYTVAPASMSLTAHAWPEQELTMQAFPSPTLSPDTYTSNFPYQGFDDTRTFHQSFINPPGLSPDAFRSAMNYTQSLQNERKNYTNLYAGHSTHLPITPPPKAASLRKDEKEVSSEDCQRRWRIARSPMRKSLDTISRNGAGRRSQPSVSPISNSDLDSYISICSEDNEAADPGLKQPHTSMYNGRCHLSSVESSPTTPNHGQDRETGPLPQPKYKCNICGYMFTRRSNCRDHIKRHDPKQRRSFGCHECSKVFGRKTDLKRHIQSVSCRRVSLWTFSVLRR